MDDFSTAMSCPDASGHFVSSIKSFRKCKKMSWRPLPESDEPWSSSKSVFSALLTSSLGSWICNIRKTIAHWPWGCSLHTVLGFNDQMHYCFSSTWWGEVNLPAVETLEQNTVAKLELCRPFLVSLKPVPLQGELEVGQYTSCTIGKTQGTKVFKVTKVV